MTYLLRLTLLASAVFFLTYVLLSVAVAIAWVLVRKRAYLWGARVLYGVRIAPLAMAVAIVGLLVVPSFLYLEPVGTGETLGELALALAFGGIVLGIAGVVSLLSASWGAARFVAACGMTQLVQISGSDVPAIQIALSTPVLVVAGVFRPRLLVSEEVRHRLEPGEFQAAIQHELAHVRSHDNLKKLVLRFARFPLLSGLERSWLRAAELAADDAAATNESVALDLASALLKVASESNVAQLPELAMSLVHQGEGALRARVERLLAWKRHDRQQRWFPYGLTSLAFAISVLAFYYSPLLRQVHEFTELFAR